MSQLRTGRVHGNVVELDTPAPTLEGQRVLVLLEAVDEEPLARDELAPVWAHWVASGPRGPIEDDDPAFP